MRVNSPCHTARSDSKSMEVEPVTSMSLALLRKMRWLFLPTRYAMERMPMQRTAARKGGRGMTGHDAGESKGHMALIEATGLPESLLPWTEHFPGAQPERDSRVVLWRPAPMNRFAFLTLLSCPPPSRGKPRNGFNSHRPPAMDGTIPSRWPTTSMPMSLPGRPGLRH